MKPAFLLYPHISSYPVLMLLGFFFGWLLARNRAPLFKLEKRHLDNIALLLPISGLIGARFFARLFYEKVSLLEALRVWEGDGLVFYGGFIFSVAAILTYALFMRVRIVNFLDCLAPSAALGLAFGRVGCFLAGCCWGDVCVDPHQLAALKDPVVQQRLHTVPSISTTDWPLAVTFPQKSEAYKSHLRHGLIESSADRSLPVHPVQLYEALLAAALCWLLHAARKKSFKPGQISIGLLLGYALIRFGTEYLRADNSHAYWGLTFSQMVSIYIAVFSFVLLGVSYVTGRRQKIDAREPIRDSHDEPLTVS